MTWLHRQPVFRSRGALTERTRRDEEAPETIQRADPHGLRDGEGSTADLQRGIGRPEQLEVPEVPRHDLGTVRIASKIATLYELVDDPHHESVGQGQLAARAHGAGEARGRIRQTQLDRAPAQVDARCVGGPAACPEAQRNDRDQG